MPVLGKMKEDPELKVNLGYKLRHCLEQQQQQQKQKDHCFF
jgi:hypothetical protein